MISDLEERLADTLARAADEAPVPAAADPLVAVRARQRRRRRRRATLAAACAIAVVAVSVSVSTAPRPSPPRPDPAIEYGFSPDKIPDFANLPEPAKLWPDAVHRLPPTLPDGSAYAVGAVLGNDRYLVSGGAGSVSAPSIFDTRAGTVTVLGTSAMSEGFVPTFPVLMAKAVDGQAVWMVEGTRGNRHVREVWAAPLDGGPARHLADLGDGSAPRFSVAGDSIIWDQQTRGSAKSPEDFVNSVRTVPVHGGPVTDVPGSQGFDLVNLGPWIKNQHRGTGPDPRTAGELRNVMTGERLPWKVASSLQFLACGPAWCTGHAPDERVGLQSLDGSDPIELPYGGALSPTSGGRLAVGHLELPTGAVVVIWDRTTGWAAGLKPQTDPGPLSGGYSFDQDAEVLTLVSTRDQFVVLDLNAVR